MEKRKQRDEIKETGRRQKGRYKKNIQYLDSESGIRGSLTAPLCPFCNTHLSVDHILWECKETEDQRMNMNMKKNNETTGKRYGKDN
jgi:hypothetical protein